MLLQTGQEVSIFKLLFSVLDYRRDPRSGSYTFVLSFQPLDSHSLSAYFMLDGVCAELGVCR